MIFYKQHILLLVGGVVVLKPRQKLWHKRPQSQNCDQKSRSEPIRYINTALLSSVTD